MIKRLGDMFTTDAGAIGHGVNCKGVMGAGVAKIVKDKFPRNYDAYKTACDLEFLRPGETFVHYENDTLIFNMASQENPGADAQYLWVLQSAIEAAQVATQRGLKKIAIPQIGCGIGGLVWEPVEHILISVELSFSDFEFEVWKL